MTRPESINLIRLFDFYLAVMLLLSFRRRYQVYWDAIRLAFALQGRWPRLLDRIRVHSDVLLTREVMRPTLMAVALVALQYLLSRGLFPEAQLTWAQLVETPWQIAVLFLAMLPMLTVDGYFLLRVGRINRQETEGYLDQAERWLSAWKAGLLRTVTFGYIDPRQIVDDEVRKALASLGELVRWSMWWVSLQICCRTLFGLTIWGIWILR